MGQEVRRRCPPRHREGGLSVDFPRAWEITRAVKPEYHHNKCSYNVAAMLCDCDVLMQHPETTDQNVFHGVNGPIPRADSGRAG